MELKLTIIADSTVDNKTWIKRKEGELSVVEHIQRLLTGWGITDLTNDGFTTSDCLNGAFRDKIFGEGKNPLYPHVRLAPLENIASLQLSNVIILSIGGNNMREFFGAISREKDHTRKKYIQDNYPNMLNKMLTEYCAIVKKIIAINPNAKIILMTQYYPSFKSNPIFNLYELVEWIAQALGRKESARDFIHNLMRNLYKNIFENIGQHKNIIVADVTSSLNPFNYDNHQQQIEPSGKGGEIIAKLLSYVAQNSDQLLGKTLRFNTLDQRFESHVIDSWTPHHPNQLNVMECSRLLKEIEIETTKADTDPNIRKSAAQIHEEGNNLFFELSPENRQETAVDQLRLSLTAILNAFKFPDNITHIEKLAECADKIAPGKSERQWLVLHTERKGLSLLMHDLANRVTATMQTQMHTLTTPEGNTFG